MSENKIVQLRRMTDIGQINGGSGVGGAVHLPCVINHAKQRGGFLRYVIQQFFKAEGAVAAAERLQHIQNFRRMPALFQRLLNRQGAAIVAFSRAAA